MKIREGKLVVLLLGFLSGNLFGTVLDFLRKFLVWDVLIITTLLLGGEIISYISYNKSCFEKKTSEKFPFSLGIHTTLNLPCSPSKGVSKAGLNSTPFCPFCPAGARAGRGRAGYFGTKETLERGKQSKKQFYLNFFKIGIMIGFFVDAFKVGS